MKKLLLLILLPFITFAQLEATGELRIDLLNYGTSWNVTITLSAVGARWDEDFNLTEDYETVSDNVSSSTPIEYVAYFDHILDIGENPTFAVGLYKINAIENGNVQAYFYIDWRTSDHSESLDLYFAYDVGNNRFRNSSDTETIDFSYQTLWDLTDNAFETSGLEDYWANSLALINDGSNHYKLVWGPYPDNNFDVINYKIYRKLNLGNWVLIGTVNSDTFTYVDEEIVTGNKRGVVKYYIKAYDGSTETDPTNTVTGFYEQYNPNKVGTTKLIDKQRDYSLAQNYPNPFNPSTIITWQSPVDDVVTLKVFDVLGREVAKLVNERREAGTHSVEFNASDLPSGIYLYSIQIGNYMETRKLILQK